MATTLGAWVLANATASAIWSKCPWQISMRSTRSTFFRCSGQAGLPMIHGSIKMCLPLGLTILNVLCPYQVIAQSFFRIMASPSVVLRPASSGDPPACASRTLDEQRDELPRLDLQEPSLPQPHGRDRGEGERLQGQERVRGRRAEFLQHLLQAGHPLRQDRDRLFTDDPADRKRKLLHHATRRRDDEAAADLDQPVEREGDLRILDPHRDQVAHIVGEAPGHPPPPPAPALYQTHRPPPASPP